jgi:hypothetical protein
MILESNGVAIAVPEREIDGSKQSAKRLTLNFSVPLSESSLFRESNRGTGGGCQNGRLRHECQRVRGECKYPPYVEVDIPADFVIDF